MVSNISETIYPFTLEKIYGKYWGCPCKYKAKDGGWRIGRVGLKTMHAVIDRQCVMFMKPLTKIDIDIVKRLFALMGEKFEDDGDFKLDEYIQHLIEHIDMASYVIVDYLRKEFFHVPVFGLDLFRAGIAQEIDENRWVDRRDSKRPGGEQKSGSPDKHSSGAYNKRPNSMYNKDEDLKL